MNGLGANAPTNGDKDDVFGCRHRAINRHIDSLIATAGKDTTPEDMVNLVELGRMILLNLNSISESLDSIATSLAVLSNQPRPLTSE